MRTVRRIDELRREIAGARREGKRIGFVPTMGFLHEGHLTLVDEARKRADVMVMSIFVNPLQFGPGEDFTRYPRDPAGDATQAERRGVELLFTPDVDDLYPEERAVSVVPVALAAEWEGAVRPGHFAGVLTVVAKLFNIVRPDVAVFGQKDIQQATLVRAMVRDLDFPLEIVVAATVREADGLAMSSRNSYLRGEDRARATVLSRALFAMRDAYARGERDGARLESVGRGVLAREPAVTVNYLALVDGRRLARAAAADDDAIAIVAARVGTTRLIDNVILGAP